jgi:hypothetical protein
VIVTTNLAFGEWPTVFGDAKKRWVRFLRQFGGLAKVDSGSDYAASFSCSLSIA